jgi:uncharacterized protein
MLIDIKNLTSVKRDFECRGDVSFYRSGLKVPADVELIGTVYKDNASYIVQGEVKAVLSLNCDLCLSPVTENLSFEFNEVFSTEQSEDDEIWVLTAEEIDKKAINPEPALIADIMLNMPMSVLCSEACQGLCPKCGHNLNNGDCGCDRVQRNPQFEMLLNLFKDEGDDSRESD